MLTENDWSSLTQTIAQHWCDMHSQRRDYSTSPGFLACIIFNRTSVQSQVSWNCPQNNPNSPPGLYFKAAGIENAKKPKTKFLQLNKGQIRDRELPSEYYPQTSSNKVYRSDENQLSPSQHRNRTTWCG